MWFEKHRKQRFAFKSFLQSSFIIVFPPCFENIVQILTFEYVQYMFWVMKTMAHVHFTMINDHLSWSSSSKYMYFIHVLAKLIMTIKTDEDDVHCTMIMRWNSWRTRPETWRRSFSGVSIHKSINLILPMPYICFCSYQCWPIIRKDLYFIKF